MAAGRLLYLLGFGLSEVLDDDAFGFCGELAVVFAIFICHSVDFSGTSVDVLVISVFHDVFVYM